MFENFLRGEYNSVWPPPIPLWMFLLIRCMCFGMALLTEILQPCLVERDARVVDVMRCENGFVMHDVTRFAAALAQAEHRRDVAVAATLPCC